MACVHRSAGGNLLFDRIWSRHEDVFSNGHEALEWHVQQTSECLVCQCIFTQPSYVSIHCNRLFNDEIHECGPATESWSYCWNFRRNASRNMTSESRSPMRTTRHAECRMSVWYTSKFSRNDRRLSVHILHITLHVTSARCVSNSNHRNASLSRLWSRAALQADDVDSLSSTVLLILGCR